tara:strand:- start:133 stop:432 length:300 start_codon:yes stop_codon:yes gene_type:complete
MKEFFEALAAMPPPKPKVHTVKINGHSVVVTLEKKLEVMKHGEDAYEWISHIEFALKKKPIAKLGYKKLVKGKKGYSFHNNDPFYPKTIVEEGWVWEQR